jgi:hypothetical protein
VQAAVVMNGVGASPPASGCDLVVGLCGGIGQGVQAVALALEGHIDVVCTSSD